MIHYIKVLQCLIGQRLQLPNPAFPCVFILLITSYRKQTLGELIYFAGTFCIQVSQDRLVKHSTTERKKGISVLNMDVRLLTSHIRKCYCKSTKVP